jgi:hypothetical protein
MVQPGSFSCSGVELFEEARQMIFKKGISTGLYLMLALALCAGNRARAQAVFGSIYGTVADSSGAAIPNATVTVTDVDKGINQTVQSNESGNYRIDRLVPDTYMVKVSANGFADVETKGIVVTANGAPKVDETLSIAGTSQQVTVTSAPPALQTDSAQISDRVDEKTIANLPNLTGNFMQTQALTAGTSPSTGNNSASQDPQGSASYSINGQNFGTQSWILDGTDDRDPVLGIIVINPTLDSVQGMQVLTQNYNAEFGGASGGIITAETRSGSNALHGDVYFYRYSDAQQARNPFTQFQPNPLTGRYLPPNVYARFGGSISGPIIKNRTFFFADYQGTRQKSGQSLLVNVPTNLVRSTCLSPTSTMCNLSEYLGSGNVGQVYNPITGVAYTGNMIPTSQLAPQAVGLLSELPAPNVAGAGTANNYAASGFGPNNANQADIRLDDQTTQKMHTFARYDYARYTLSGSNIFGAAGGVGLDGSYFAGTDWSQDQSVSAGFDMALTPKMATDFRFGLMKYQVNQNEPDIGAEPATTLGIPGLNTGTLDTSGNPDYLFNSGTLTNLGANVTYNGTQICNCPLKQSEHEYQVTNNWTRTAGNHTIRFGGDIRYATQLRSASDTNRTGVLQFNASSTSSSGLPGTASAGSGGLDLGTALLGDVTSFQRFIVYNNAAASNQKRMAYYGQDTWRVTPALTLTYGLRWELTFPETVNAAGNGGFVNLSTGYVQVAGVGGIGTNGGEKMDYKNFSPRAGIAYNVNPSLVLRAGAAIMYDSEGFYGTLFGTALTEDTPVYTTQSLTAAASFGPNGSVFNLANGPTLPAPPVVPPNGLIPMANNTSYPSVRPLTLQLARVDQWNVSLQQQMGSRLTVDIAYVGNLAERTYPGTTEGYNLNTQRLPTTPAELGNVNARMPLFNRFNNNGVVCCNTSLNSVAPSAHANYNGLQTSLKEQLRGGLSLNANYTWSKAMNNSGTYFNQDPGLTYSRNDLNRTNVFNLYGVYDLPFGHGQKYASGANGLVNYAIGGWALSGTSTWMSGLPFTPTYAECNADEDVDTSVSNGVLCRPNGSPMSLPHGARAFNTATHTVTFFTPVAPLSQNGSSSGPFQRPAFGTVGNSGRNSFTGPREFLANASLSKTFPITQRVNGQFIVQASNLFNHPALSLPTASNETNGPCIDCSLSAGGTPGQIVGLDQNVNMRQLQFAVRVSF